MQATDILYEAPAFLPAPGNARPDTLLCLDIETVPDASLMPPDWPDDKLPKPFWNTVVCISFVEARIERRAGRETFVVTRVASGGECDWPERRLLAAFWRYLDGGCVRLATWNGRGFDLPVLRSRAFVHGLSASAWHDRGGKWDGYDRRFSEEFHADVMDLLSSHGAATRMGLDEAACSIRLPGKMGESGARVAELFERGELPRIRAYCETDALNTYALYARWCLLSGRTDEAGYRRSLDTLAEYLQTERPSRPHLGAFLDSWRPEAVSARPAASTPDGAGRPPSH